VSAAGEASMESVGAEGVTRPRSAYLDNAKAILIVIVVFTHLYTPALARLEPERFLYYLILLFHMPAFAFVSGWLSKPNLFTRKGVIALAWIAWAFIAFTIVNHLVWVFFFDAPFRPLRYVKSPYYALWFLQALVWWRVALALFGRGKGKVASIVSIVAAVAVALAAGYLPVSGGPFSIARSMWFLPFFVAGYRAKQWDLSVPRTWWSRVLAAAAFVAMFVTLMQTRMILNRKYLFFDMTFAELIEDLGAGPWTNVWGRLLLMSLSVVLVAAFLHLVPRRALPITALGVTVISVYGWHALFVRIIRQLGVTDAFVGTWPLILITTSALVLVLGYGPVAKATVFILTGKRVPGKPHPIGPSTTPKAPEPPERT
jgi:fucose 4-O-acetylase-like acetyltransferase